MPTVRKTSQEHASSAASSAGPGSDSPNQTTAGRASPPHDGHAGGIVASGTASSRQGAAPHSRQHERSQSDPCTRIRCDVPARTWRSSTFWVMTVQRSNSRDHRAITSCAGLGWHEATSARRQAYHSHTSVGFRPKRLRRRQVLGPKLAPQSPAAAEGRHPARGRDAGAGQNRDARRAAEPVGKRLELLVAHAGSQYCPSAWPAHRKLPSNVWTCLECFAYDPES